MTNTKYPTHTVSTVITSQNTTRTFTQHMNPDRWLRPKVFLMTDECKYFEHS